MGLWEQEIPPLRKNVENLERSERFRLVVEATDWTLRTAPLPVQDPEARDCIENVMREARAAVERRADSIELSEEIEDQLFELQESAEETGLPQLLEGIHRFFDGGILSGMAIEYNLYDCFEFSAQREEGHRETLEEQMASPRLREVVEYQKNLILSASQSSS